VETSFQVRISGHRSEIWRLSEICWAVGIRAVVRFAPWAGWFTRIRSPVPANRSTMPVSSGERGAQCVGPSPCVASAARVALKVCVAYRSNLVRRFLRETASPLGSLAGWGAPPRPPPFAVLFRLMRSDRVALEIERKFLVADGWSPRRRRAGAAAPGLPDRGGRRRHRGPAAGGR